MKQTHEAIARIMERLPEITHLPGAPDDPDKLLGYAKSLLRILRGLPIKCFKTQEDVIVSPDYLPYVGELPDGVVDDLDWVLMAISDNCPRFPSPIEVYKLYNKFFIPANAATVEKLQSALED